MELNGKLLFTANTSAAGRELWTSDGTGPGTVLVKDIRPGFTGSFPANDPPRLSKVGTTAFLVADDGVNGTELWKSDGTGPGTTLVIDLCVGACSSLPSSNAAGLEQVILSEVAGLLFFGANDGTTGEELYSTDGTAPGTALVLDICPGGCTPFTNVYNYWVASLGGFLYFFADDGTNGREVWKSDGTGPGTVIVKNLTTTSSLPDSLTLANGLVFFSANDGVSGDELWKSDGTEPGTTRLSDILPGSGDSSPQDLTRVGSSLLFTADDGVTLRRELWKSDGTVPGTVLVRDIHPWVGWSSNPTELTDVNGTLFLVADDGSLFLGAELWKSDDTLGGTTMVKDVFPGSSSSGATWLTNVNGTLFFRANDGTSGSELWKSDGTDPGTLLVKDLIPGASSSSPFHLTNVGGTLFFAATGPGGIGRELFKSDGTDAGTVLVKEICPGSCGGFTSLLQYNFLVAVGGMLFFTADDGVNGRELWKSDGTGPGTAMVLDIMPGSAGVRGPFSLVAHSGLLYFGADGRRQRRGALAERRHHPRHRTRYGRQPRGGHGASVLDSSGGSGPGNSLRRDELRLRRRALEECRVHADDPPRAGHRFRLARVAAVAVHPRGLALLLHRGRRKRRGALGSAPHGRERDQDRLIRSRLDRPELHLHPHHHEQGTQRRPRGHRDRHAARGNDLSLFDSTGLYRDGRDGKMYRCRHPARRQSESTDRGHADVGGLLRQRCGGGGRRDRSGRGGQRDHGADRRRGHLCRRSLVRWAQLGHDFRRLRRLADMEPRLLRSVPSLGPHLLQRLSLDEPGVRSGNRQPRRALLVG